MFPTTTELGYLGAIPSPIPAKAGCVHAVRNTVIRSAKAPGVNQFRDRCWWLAAKFEFIWQYPLCVFVLPSQIALASPSPAIRRKMDFALNLTCNRI